ncbi:MAG: Ig-like domain-containing protein [Chloroflexi bacterium]|nr:Ig-like domain-containing protein [Chloroflexota bacterium]
MRCALPAVLKARIAAVLLLAVSLGASVASVQGGDRADGNPVSIELRVWQHVLDTERIYVSARPVGGDWRTLGTIPLPLDDGYSSNGSCRYGGFTVAGVELRVWQHVRDAERIYVGAGPMGVDCPAPGTIPLPLDDGHSSSGSYRYGDLTIAVPHATPAVVVSPGGAAVPRLATVRIAFRDPPREADASRLVSIDPPAQGAFVWADERTLLFQPAFPGWQRGQQYRLRVDAGTAGIAADQAHTFTVEGQLEVSYVIPGDGDREVPTTAQILVQFNRSVAPLTVLQEGSAAAVLEFDPPLAGRGEWLNTSLYRFIPTDLQPSAEYAVRIPAGLTSAADGVLASDFAWSFATVQPAITSFTPSDNSVHVEPDSPVVVAFNQPMDRASVETGLALREKSGDAIVVSFAWSEVDTVVTLTPAGPLALSAAYEVIAPAGLRGAGGGATHAERVVRFTTIEPPQLVRTDPQDGETAAWPYGIELHYNNPMDIDSFEGRVSISGVDPEDIEPISYSWRSETVYLDVRLQFSTDYTVRIAEGVRDRGGRPLPASEFSFTTRAPWPSLSLAAPASFSTFSASRQQVLYYHAAQLEEVRFRLYRLSDSEAETLLRRGFIDGWSANDQEYVTFQPGSDPIREWVEPIDEDLRGASRLYSTALSTGEPLSKDHYLVVADNAAVELERKLVLSVVDAAIVTKLAFDELLVWALDYNTGEPISGAEVRVAPLEEPPHSPYETAVTDVNGLARFAVPSQNTGDSYYFWGSPYGDYLVRIDEGGRRGVASTWWDSGSSPWELDVPAHAYFPGTVGHLYTDRPIYRPGETVFYKGVVRDEEDASYSIPGTDVRFTVTIRDARYAELLQTSVQISDLGTFADELTLPGDAPTGTYRVELFNDGRYIATTHFTVAEFRAPEFEVEVTAAGAHFLADDTIPTEVAARFFFGGAVADADVEWAALASPTAIRVEGYEDYSFSDHDYYRTRADGYRDPVRDRGETRTDASGIARFDVHAALEADEGTQQFTISATVTDANAQAVANSTTVTVHPATWYAGIKPESYIATAGEPEAVHLVTVDVEGRIAPRRAVTVRIFEREWIRTKERADHGGYRYRSEPRDTEIAAPSAMTNESGEAMITFTPPSAGTYRLVAESTDEQGRVARSATFLWVSGEEYAPWRVRDDDIIELIADRERYEVGDTAEVLVPAPFAGATGLVTIERGRVLSSEARSFDTNSEVLRIPIEDAHLPNVYVGVVLYRPPTTDDPLPRYHVGYAELSVSAAPRALDVRIEPDREQAAPGETVRYEVQANDGDGRGVAAEVSVAIVDQAVLSLADEAGPDGMGAFWYERALGVRTASSLAVSIDRRNEAYRDAVEGDEGRGEGDAEKRASGSASVALEEEAPAAEAPADESLAQSSPEGSAGPRLRSDFRHTALWIGQLVTDANGRASFELPLPDNATTWRALSRAVNGATQVGEGESELLVTQPLLVRPALPRFLRVGDAVILQALVRNGTTAARDVTIALEAEGLTLDGEASLSGHVEPDDSTVFEWPARALAEGRAALRFRAIASGGYGDAIEISIPVYLDVTPETTATGGVVEDVPAVEAVYLPDYVVTEAGSLELSIQGSLVGALDTELSHFSPYRYESSVRIASRVVATVAVQRATGGGLTEAQKHQLQTDVTTLIGMQHYDGAWGWCRGCRSNLWVSGWVLFALGEARDAGRHVPDDVLTRAARLITSHVNRETDVERPANPNQHAFLLYALASAANPGGVASTLARDQAGAMRAIVEQHRTSLTSWGRAYLLLGLLASGHDAGHTAVRALLNDLTATTIASANGNHWEDQRRSGSMHNGSVRPTALVLRALTEVDPNHPLIEETARWLVTARTADRWKTSVERAQGMAALGAFAELTGETRGAYDYTVWLNDRQVLDGDFDVPAGDYHDGAAIALADLPLGQVSRVQFERDASRDGRLYYGLNLRYVTPARDIEALNRGFAISHQYSLLDEPERAITSAALGDVVRVRLTVVAPADRLFAKIEDFLPAGLEPIDPRLNIAPVELRQRLQAERAESPRGSAPSYYAPWYAWYYSPWDQVDIRDDRVVLLASHLPQGVHEYVYYARATAPGDFFVAPARAEESYFPEVFGRGDSGRFTVQGGE